MAPLVECRDRLPVADTQITPLAEDLIKTYWLSDIIVGASDEYGKSYKGLKQPTGMSREDKVSFMKGQLQDLKKGYGQLGTCPLSAVVEGRARVFCGVTRGCVYASRAAQE